MIQRIQTIFLLLAAATFGALFKLPMASSDKATAQFLSDRIFDVTDHAALLSPAILGVVLSLVTIFLFRNRKLQLKLGYGIIVVAILLPLITFLLFTNESARIEASTQVTDEIGMFLPIGAILFGALANYFIRKDDRLVKSMDRLR